MLLFAAAPTCCIPGVAARLPCAYVPGMSQLKDQDQPEQPPQVTDKPPAAPPKPKEIGGPKGPEPTRYGDWEVNGRCSDF
jgi:hypothetical protein